MESSPLKPPFHLNEVGAVRIRSQGQLIGVLVVGRKTAFSHYDELLLESLADLTASTLHRANLFDQTRAYARQIEAVEIAGRSMAETLSIDEIHTRLAEALLSTFSEIESVSIWQCNQQSGEIERVLGLKFDNTELPQDTVTQEENEQAPIPPEILEGMQSQKTCLVGGPLGDQKDYGRRDGSTLVMPALRNESVMAVLEIHSLDTTFFTPEKIDLIALIGNSAAIAYENALLYSEVEKRLSQLQSLRDIDAAIVSSLDDEEVLKVLLQKFREQLNVDAAIIWMPDGNNQHFTAARTSGLPDQHMAPRQLDKETSLAGAALKRNQVLPVSEDMPEAAWMEPLAFRSAYAAPMVAQGQPLGSVEVFSYTEIAADVDWYRMFETLARQGAVALSTLHMFKDLQQKNTDLIEAYNATIEGWAMALDMRDHETRGHSLRVADMTVELARYMGVAEDELEHIRRGALLHDIGKMGIPDSVLLKAGSLNDKEWETMRLHPILAAEFLKNIQFLKGAMDIPVYHHEWWNGKGYPHGLKGEEIPKAARIFAVVDVWDALKSDRPYRLAWPEEAVLPYLLTQSGTHFDPQVIDMFLRYLQEHESGRGANHDQS
jgi:putative nucleotidyltransferase with HDIG domain